MLSCKDIQVLPVPRFCFTRVWFSASPYTQPAPGSSDLLSSREQEQCPLAFVLLFQSPHLPCGPCSPGCRRQLTGQGPCHPWLLRAHHQLSRRRRWTRHSVSVSPQSDSERRTLSFPFHRTGNQDSKCPGPFLQGLTLFAPTKGLPLQEDLALWSEQWVNIGCEAPRAGAVICSVQPGSPGRTPLPAHLPSQLLSRPARWSLGVPIDIQHTKADDMRVSFSWPLCGRGGEGHLPEVYPRPALAPAQRPCSEAGPLHAPG
ncbi:hypothetical protein AAY473_012599 [Plecturocebus cupreus]